MEFIIGTARFLLLAVHFGTEMELIIGTGLFLVPTVYIDTEIEFIIGTECFFVPTVYTLIPKWSTLFDRSIFGYIYVSGPLRNLIPN